MYVEFGQNSLKNFIEMLIATKDVCLCNECEDCKVAWLLLILLLMFMMVSMVRRMKARNANALKPV